VRMANVKVRMLLVAAVVCLTSLASASSSKEKDPTGQIVDSGSFGVFVNGTRVATETFSIEQSNNGSIATSRFKTEKGIDPAEQSSELQLTTGGDLRKYEWKEITPGKAQAVVVPSETLLVERSFENPDSKPQEHPFLLPASTSILDDYFFVQREILSWKYLAMACHQDHGRVSCPVAQKAQFGALNAHARSSLLVSMEFAGKEKVPIRGVERELNRITLKSEFGEWSLWLDDEFKLQRILVPGDNTEVVRD
jgi:hypothetical protein